MVQRFVRDDAGYVAWLAAHSGGWVLNTFPHVTSQYLVLHRASCRTVNRPLETGRTWTFAYGKSCSDDRGELEAWATEIACKPPKPCGTCLGRGAGLVNTSNASGFHSTHDEVSGGRRPHSLTEPISMVGEGITIRIPPMASGAMDCPELVIEGAQWLAETFFRRDPSATGKGSYDEWIADTQEDSSRRDRIDDGDVTAVNRTMAARTSHETWGEVIRENDWSWLTAIDPAWELFALDAPEWATGLAPEVLRTAFAAVKRPGLNIAVITKVLHIKRPKLIPVLDSLVLGQVGGRVSDDVASWVDVIEHLRAVGLANHNALVSIRQHLRATGLHERSLVRILDSLLWTCTPGSALYARLEGWERIFRPVEVERTSQ